MTKFLLGFFSFGWLRGLDFLPPLLLRLFLAPLLWVSGVQKIGLFKSPDADFLNPMTWVDMDAYAATVTALKESAFAVPFPELMAWIVPSVEIVGAVCLLIGFAVRWVSIPLLTLVSCSLLMVVFGAGVTSALEGFTANHGFSNPDFAEMTQLLTYFIMLLTLFFMGAGRFFSIDWLLYRKLQRRITRKDSQRAVVANDPFAVNATTN
ncbi:DoxX family protein [Leucothrix sargassi]|nr:DoxX family protein [Leucothrix sargassi]